MAEYHFPVPGSVDEGRIILFLRRHWASYLGQIFLSIFLFFFPIFLIAVLYYSERTFFHGWVLNLMVLGFSTYYLVIITFIFTAWLAFYYDMYVITDTSIIDVNQQGFLGRKIVQISLLRVQDVSSNISGLLPTVFAYGNVLIETAGEQTQTLTLDQIPNPQEVAARIMQLHNDLVQIEGRHHQILEAEGSLAPGKIGPGGHIAGAGHPVSEKESENDRTIFQELLEKQNQVVEPEQKAEQPIAKTEPESPGPEPEPITEEEPDFPEPSQMSEEIEPAPKKETGAEGEIKHEDLDKGGEVDFK